jgi:hypothetical protein
VKEANAITARLVKRYLLLENQPKEMVAGIKSIEIGIAAGCTIGARVRKKIAFNFLSTHRKYKHA